jgi:hypothetical protein
MAGAVPNGKRDYDLVFVPLQLSVSFWHMGFMEFFLISKKIMFQIIQKKNIWIEPTVYTTNMQNCNTKYLVFFS